MPARRGLSVLCVLVCLTPGCGYDTGPDLRPAVERVTPSGALRVAACGGSSGLIDEPSYSCLYMVPGRVGVVTQTIATALQAQGFAVSCARPGELAALRGNVRITAEVTGEGSISRSGGVANVLAGGYRPEGSRPIPRGSVVLDLDATRQPESSAAFWRRHVAEGGRCDRARIPIHPLEVCVAWWNGPVGMTTSEAARRRRAGPGVHIVRAERPGVSTCTYTVRVPRGYARLTARFDHGKWIWPPLRAVPPPRPFSPNARLEANGWLSLDG
jgi:hypothetical protein